MNNKRGHIVRTVLGGYLVYLGIRILMRVIENKPSDQMLMSVLSVLFIIIGSCYAGFSIRGLLRAAKSEKGQAADPMLEEELSSRGSAGSSEIDPVQTGKKRSGVELQQIGPDRRPDEAEHEKEAVEENPDAGESKEEKTEKDREEM